MIPYFFMLAIPSVLAFYRRSFSRSAVLFVTSLFVLFVGLRFRVGADWPNYNYIHQRLHDTPALDVFSRQEPLSNLLFWASQNWGYGMLLTNLVAAAILVTGVAAFARRTRDPWLAFVAATPYLIIAFGMTGIRQAMGVGIFLFVLSRWQESSTLNRTMAILVASLFHTSAIFCGILVVLTLRVRRLVQIPLAVLLSVLGYYLTSSVDIYSVALTDYDHRYLRDPNRVVSTGSLFHIGLILLPAAIAYLTRTSLRQIVSEYRILMLGVAGTVGLLGLNLISTTAASRLTLYFYFIPMLVYPALIHMVRTENQGLIKLGLVAMHFVIMLTWFLFANNSIGHLPYRSVLF